MNTGVERVLAGNLGSSVRSELRHDTRITLTLMALKISSQTMNAAWMR